MRLIIAISLLFLVTACSSSNTESTEKTSSDVNEEEKYINLLLNEDYKIVLEQTENEDSSVQENYNNIALVLQRYQNVTENTYTNGEYASRYGQILTRLEEVDNIPDELKEQLEEVKKVSTEKKEYYTKLDKEEERLNDIKTGQEMIEEEQMKNKMDARTLNPQPVKIGMTKEEVLTEGWGRPNDINKTTTAYGTSEQWVYDNYNYLYFEDGILTSIQN